MAIFKFSHPQLLVAVFVSLFLIWIPEITPSAAATGLPKNKSFNFRCKLNRTNSDDSLPINNNRTNPGTIKIGVSARPLPQIVSRIYAIIIQDVLETGHTLEFQPPHPRGKYNVAGEVILENFVLVDDTKEDRLHLDGQLYPSGYIGWYIPKDLIGGLPDPLSYKVFAGSIHESIREQFQWDAKIEDMIQSYLEIVPKSNEIGVEKRSFTPKWCKSRKHECVTILAGYYLETTRFLKGLINDFELSVRVLWLGGNLTRVVDRLHKEFLEVPYIMPDYRDEELTEGNSTQNPSRLIHKKFLVFGFSPSVVIDGDIEFERIEMPSCRDISKKEGIHCAYSELPVLKYSTFHSNMGKVEALTKAFNFTDVETKGLIDAYNAKRKISQQQFSNETEMKASLRWQEEEGEILNTIACDFVNSNPDHFTTSSVVKEQYQISIGLILPSTGLSFYPVIETVVQEAVESINLNRNILKNVKVNLLSHSITSCEELQLMKAYVTMHNENTDHNVIGVVGPPCIQGLEALTAFTEVTRMVTVSYGPTTMSFDSGKGYKNFFRTVGESRSFGPALVQFLQINGWSRVAAFSQDGATSSYLSHTVDLFKNGSIDLLIHHKLPVLDQKAQNTAKLIEDRLSDLRGAKIILVEVYDLKTIVQLLCTARRLHMTAKEGIVWIVPSWAGDYQYSTDKMELCSVEEISEALENQFSFDFPSYVPNNQTLPLLNNTTTDSWWRDHEVQGAKYIGYAFDAVWTLALAFDGILHSGNFTLENSVHNEKHYLPFLSLLNASNFTGVSGQIRFPERQSRRPQVVLNQWRGLEMHRVGWEDSLTNTTLIVRGIKWFGDSDQPPSDGRPVCSVQGLAHLLHLDCDSAILLLVIVLCFTCTIVASIAFFTYVRRFYNKKMKLSAQVMRNLGIDLLNTTSAPEHLLVDYEMPKDQIMLNRKLGEGAFGTVYGGQAYIDGSRDLKAVAVKTLKIGSTSEDRLDFLSEAEAMKSLNHPNILKLLGVCLKSEPIFTVIEFMLYGDLKTYLLARRHLVKERIPDDSDVSPKRLTLMTMDILGGLAYLAERKYVHRDIACRNCLVNVDRRVKIGDFGMARPTGSSDYYRFSRKGLLPVRWLSPESLSTGFFTPASDIWSFGVVLFELVTFGAFPYQGLSNNQVLEFVKSGGSMSIPEGVQPPLARLMSSCWEVDYRKRPTALQILEFVANNPRLVVPCVDQLKFSLQFTDNESDDLDFNPPTSNGCPDSITGLQALSAPQSNLQSAAAEALQQQQQQQAGQRREGNGQGRWTFLKGRNGGGGVPNGSGLLTYNPVEPLLLRQNSNEVSNSSSSLLMRYVPMCGFGRRSNGDAVIVGNNNYSSYSPSANGNATANGSVRPIGRDNDDGDSEYTVMSLTEF